MIRHFDKSSGLPISRNALASGFIECHWAESSPDWGMGLPSPAEFEGLAVLQK